MRIHEGSGCKTHQGLLPVGTEHHRLHVCAHVCERVQAIYHRDRPVRVYLMMWGFIYEVMADVWEGEEAVRE